MGFWSDEVEVAGLTSIELITGNRVAPENEEPYSLADETAIKSVMINNPNDMEAYRMQYMVGFRRKYREAYSADTLSHRGFLPESSQLKSIDEDLFLDWLSTQTNPQATTLINTSIGTVTAYAEARFYLQNTYGGQWSNTTDTLTDSDVNGLVGDWKLTGAKHGDRDVKITMSSLSGHPEQHVNIPYTVPVTPDSPSVSTSQYKSTYALNDWYIYIAPLSDIPDSVWNKGILNMSPIVPIKKNDIMNSEKRNVINTLDELGVGGEQLWDQLIKTCPESYTPPEDDPNKDCDEEIKIPSTIDNAYILTGIAPDTTDSGVYAGLFLWFDTFSGASGVLSLQMESLGIGYNFSLSKIEKTGVVGRLNTYHKTIQSNIDSYQTGFSGEEMILQWQNTEDTYQEIIVTNFEQHWSIMHNSDLWGFKSFLSWDGDTGDKNTLAQARLVIPLDMYNNMAWEHWVPVHETGMCMIAFSQETIKLKWWQTGIFKIILLIVVTIVTWGQGSAPAATFMEIAIQTAINMAIAMAIGAVATVLASMTDNEFLQMVIYFVAAIATMYLGGFNFNNISGFDNFLKLADEAFQAYNKVENMAAASQISQSEEDIKTLKDENEALEEEVKAMEGVNAAIYIQDYNMDIASTTANGVLSPDEYFHQKQGGDLYDFDALYDVTGVYAMKKNVKV